MAAPEPAPTSTAPTVTQFPKPEDPDAVFRAAIQEAKKQNRPIEVTEAFTETARHWAYPDGHLTTQSYAGPTQLKQADGSWAFIDTTLVEQNGVLKPKLAKADLEFSVGGQDRPFASMERGNGQRFSLTWPTALPKPTLTGNIATYADAAGYPGADLVVTALPTGFRHDVVLRERPKGPVEFRIPVDTDGLIFTEGKKGGLRLTDTKGKEIASAAEPLATDAGPNPAEASTHQAVAARSGKIDTRVVKDKGRQVLVLKPDPAFLNDPATRYPVTVDPTTTLTLQSDLVVDNTGTEDTSPASPKLVTGIARIHSDGHLSYSHSLLKFDTGPLAGRSVGNARLDMYADQLVGCRWHGPGGIEAKRITSAWPASGVGWSSQPSVTSFGSSVQFCPSTPSIDDNGNWIPHPFSWDITAMAQAWASGYPNHGIRLSAKGTTEPTQNTSWSVYFHSAERTGGTRPKLTVSYYLPPEIPTVTAESIDSLTGNDAIARSQSVKVGFKSSVPEGTNLDYTVTVNDSTMAPPPAFPTGHVAHWKFDEPASAAAAADSGPNGHMAAYTGSRRAAITGKLSGAIQLNDMTGSNGCCIPDSYASTSKAVLNQNSSFSLSTWVRLNDSEAIQYVASQDGDPFGLGIYYLGGSYQKWRLQISGTGGTTGYGVWVDSAKLAKADTWTHLVAMYDASTAKIRLYVDGMLSGEADYQPSGTVTGGPFRIGGHKSGLNFLQGAVDDMRLYQRTLTLKEIKDLYGEVAATSYNAKPSGQVIEQTFTLDNPASLKFIVKACRSGIAQPSCNESPAYRITADAAMLPTDMETLLNDPLQPILSAAIARPSGDPVTGKFYLYDEVGNPVGASPLGYGTVGGDRRISMQIPGNTVRSGAKYTWQIQACTEDICTAKTSPQSFTVPGPVVIPDPGTPSKVVLRQDSFVIKTAKAASDACDGRSCALADSPIIKVGGGGADSYLSALKISFADIPEGAIPVKATLRLGDPSCGAATCPEGATVGVTPLSGEVTSTSTAAAVQGALKPEADYSAPFSAPNIDLAGETLGWLALTSNSAQVVDFGSGSQMELELTYQPPTAPSAVQDLRAAGAEKGILASWAGPLDPGSTAMIESYDVQVLDANGQIIQTLTAKSPFVMVSGLTSGSKYRLEVRPTTRFGAGPWESVETTVPLPPAPTCPGTSSFTSAIKSFEESKNNLLEQTATTVDNATNSDPNASAVKAILYTQQPDLVAWASKSDVKGIQQTGSSVTVDDALLFYGPNGTTATVQAAISLAYDYAGEGGVDPATDQTSTVHTYNFSLASGCGRLQLTNWSFGGRVVSVTPDLNAFPDGTPGQVPADGMDLPTDDDGFPDYEGGSAGGSSGPDWVNRSAAASWAVRHYRDDTTFDNDCTNFVSQALYHGGGARMYVKGDFFPSDRSDTRVWWQRWPNRLMSTYSWSSVNHFYKHFMTVHKRATWVTSWKDVRVGDILLWDFNGGSLDFGHAAVVSKVTSGSWKGVEYAQHSDPYNYRKLSVSFPSVRTQHKNAKVYAIRVWY